MKAALYARFSSDLQRAASIEDQFRNCRKRAELKGWVVVATYADAAMSGTDANRPQYRAMLEAAAQREFDILIVDDLSRPTRDAVECERAIRRLEFIGLRIVATSDGYDSNSKARKVHRGFKGLMNEIFLDDLRERVHRGLTGQAQKRFWCGGRPYGFRLKPVLDPTRLDVYGQPARIGTVLEIDGEQAAIVREIFARFVDGASCLAISRELNARGVPSPGSTWKRKTRRCTGLMASAVRVILKNRCTAAECVGTSRSSFAIPTAANTSAGGVPRRIGSRIGKSPCGSFQTRCSRGLRPARGPRLTVTSD